MVKLPMPRPTSRAIKPVLRIAGILFVLFMVVVAITGGHNDWSKDEEVKIKR
jgi:hypothetical protein